MYISNITHSHTHRHVHIQFACAFDTATCTCKHVSHVCVNTYMYYAWQWIWACTHTYISQACFPVIPGPYDCVQPLPDTQAYPLMPPLYPLTSCHGRASSGRVAMGSQGDRSRVRHGAEGDLPLLQGPPKCAWPYPLCYTHPSIPHIVPPRMSCQC